MNKTVDINDVMFQNNLGRWWGGGCALPALCMVATPMSTHGVLQKRLETCCILKQRCQWHVRTSLEVTGIQCRRQWTRLLTRFLCLCGCCNSKLTAKCLLLQTMIYCGCFSLPFLFHFSSSVYTPLWCSRMYYTAIYTVNRKTPKCFIMSSTKTRPFLTKFVVYCRE